MHTTRLLLLPALLCPLAAAATSDALVDLLAIPGSAGLGAIQRMAYTPYKNAATTLDLIPLYMYEGERFYMHGTRAGLKLTEKERYGLDVFLDYRYEGFPLEHSPLILQGMAKRQPSLDGGIAYRYRKPFGNLDLELLHDANNAHHGTELRLEYSVDLESGRWHFRPAVSVQRRSANLNNYYYGVRPEEATARRPAYMPGAGTDWSLNLYAYYDLTERWRALGGIGFTRHADQILNSPIVSNETEPALQLGVAYDFGSHKPYTKADSPLVFKAFAGRATECNFLPAVTLRCTSLHSEDNTRIVGAEIGRRLVEAPNGWPVDFTAYIGALRHDDRGIQPGGWQMDAYIKAFYYGFPWSQHVKTRLAFGAGFSYADRVPLTEVRDQARRGRNTNHLLNYLDPSVDFSVGDLLGVKAWKTTYLGLGISHRSGIFGTSQLLGNINGGSNYFYTYLETQL